LRKKTPRRWEGHENSGNNGDDGDDSMASTAASSPTSPASSAAQQRAVKNANEPRTASVLLDEDHDDDEDTVLSVDTVELARRIRAGVESVMATAEPIPCIPHITTTRTTSTAVGPIDFTRTSAEPRISETSYHSNSNTNGNSSNEEDDCETTDEDASSVDTVELTRRIRDPFGGGGGADAVRKTLDVTTTSDPPRATIGPSPWTVQQRRHFDASVLNKQGEGHQNRTQQPIDRSRGASAVPAAATKATPSMIQQQQRSRPLPPSSVQWDSSATMPPNDDEDNFVLPEHSYSSSSEEEEEEHHSKEREEPGQQQQQPNIRDHHQQRQHHQHDHTAFYAQQAQSRAGMQNMEYSPKPSLSVPYRYYSQQQPKGNDPSEWNQSSSNENKNSITTTVNNSDVGFVQRRRDCNNAALRHSPSTGPSLLSSRGVKATTAQTVPNRAMHDDAPQYLADDDDDEYAFGLPKNDDAAPLQQDWYGNGNNAVVDLCDDDDADDDTHRQSEKKDVPNPTSVAACSVRPGLHGIERKTSPAQLLQPKNTQEETADDIQNFSDDDAMEGFGFARAASSIVEKRRRHSSMGGFVQRRGGSTRKPPPPTICNTPQPPHEAQFYDAEESDYDRYQPAASTGFAQRGSSQKHLQPHYDPPPPSRPLHCDAVAINYNVEAPPQYPPEMHDDFDDDPDQRKPSANQPPWHPQDQNQKFHPGGAHNSVAQAQAAAAIYRNHQGTLRSSSNVPVDHTAQGSNRSNIGNVRHATTRNHGLTNSSHPPLPQQHPQMLNDPPARRRIREASIRPNLSARPAAQRPAPVARPSNWMTDWNHTRATTMTRNDLVGGSGVGAGSYQIAQPANNDSKDEENTSYNRNRWDSKKNKGTKRKRAGGGRGRGRGRSRGGGGRGGRGRGRGGGGTVPTWVRDGDYGDADLQNVGGAEISF
jgi:hypothetical protein